MKKIILAILFAVTFASNQLTVYALSVDEHDAISANNYFAPTLDASVACGAANEGLRKPGKILFVADNLIDNSLIRPKIEAALDGGGWSVEFTDQRGGRNLISEIFVADGDKDTTSALLQIDDLVDDNDIPVDYVVFALGAYELDPEKDIGADITTLVQEVKAVVKHEQVFWSNIGSTANGKNKEGDALDREDLLATTPERYSRTNEQLEQISGIVRYGLIDWFEKIFGGDPEADATNIDPDLVDNFDYLEPNKLNLSSAGADAWVSLVANTITGAPNVSSTDPFDAESPTPAGGALDNYTLPATRGGAAVEGNIDEQGRILDDNTGNPKDVNKATALAKHASLGQEYRDYYITMRWRYAHWNWTGNASNIDNDQLNWMLEKPRKVLVTNPDSGKSIIAVAVEAGPAPYTGTPQAEATPHSYWSDYYDGTPAEFNGRVAGFPPKASEALQMTQWEYGGPESEHERGQGSNLIYSWAPDQNAKPGPTDLQAGLANCYTQSTIGADGRVFPVFNATQKLLNEGSYNNDGVHFIWNNACVSQAQGECHHNYAAADLHAPAGTGTVAMQAGTITNVSRNTGSNGATVSIKGTDGFLYYYAHLLASSIPDFAEGVTTVAPGEFIGSFGPPENAANTGPHVHVDILHYGDTGENGKDGKYTARPVCKGAACKKHPFQEIHPALKAMYDNHMPEE